MNMQSNRPLPAENPLYRHLVNAERAYTRAHLVLKELSGPEYWAYVKAVHMPAVCAHLVARQYFTWHTK